MNELQIHDGPEKRERLVNLFSGTRLHEKVAAIPDSLRLKNEDELRDELHPTRTVFAVKRQLWRVGLAALDAGEDSLPVVRIFDNICTKQMFYEHLMQNPLCLAWLFTPPSDVSTLVEEAFLFGLSKIRNEILTLPINEKTAPIVFKAFQYFADRHLGAVTQKVETKSLHVNVDGVARPELMSREQVYEKIKELESLVDKQPAIEIEGKVD